jgi:hypothetical protein
MNDVEIIDRMIKVGVKTIWWDYITCEVDSRPGQAEVGWVAQREEYNSLEKL